MFVTHNSIAMTSDSPEGVAAFGDESDEYQDDEELSEDEGEDEEEDEDEGIAGDGDSSDEDGDEESLPTRVIRDSAAALEDVEPDDDDQALQTMLAENMATDIRKGKAVLAQQNLGKTLLENRILLQQILTGANSELWPGPSMAEAPEDLSEPQADLVSNASEALGMFLELQDSMASANGAIAPVPGSDDADDDDDESAIDAQWRRLDEGWKAVLPFVSASVDRWHHKTMLATGAAAMRSRLKSLGQSPSAHIAASLSKATQQAQEEDAEKYDDADFYRVLLTEFLDDEMKGSAPTGTEKSGKRKRAVDTRASKGRKIRYDVHDKLVNFMAPVEQPAAAFSLASFGSLFGTSMSA